VADYRLSAKVISRAKGQSSIASAAYRAAAQLHDIRTGETHDYTRKQGVVFSAIVAPDNAPDWMRDRGQLWQAVEAAEKRRDAQLAREVQLSLPHELTQEQREALLLGFVQEQFVNRGMIADVAIHLPDRDGDERNHHAHVMLTMRSLTGDGFGNKVRDWNDAETLLQWREQWAHHQNRALERHGHEARVDHRSFEDRGIDREPTQHLGPTAADMERNGKQSRIGEENRARNDNNADRADRYNEHWKLEQRQEKARATFEEWAKRKAAGITRVIDSRFEFDRHELDSRHVRQRLLLSADLQKHYGTHKATIGTELAAVDRRLQARGLTKLVRDVIGRTRSDQNHRADLRATLQSIQQRETDARKTLEKRQQHEQATLRQRSEQRKERALAGIERRRELMRAAGWKFQPNISIPPRFEKTVPEGRRVAPTTQAKEAFRSAAQRTKDDPIRESEISPRELEARERREKFAAESRSWWEKSRGDQSPSSIDQPWRSNALENGRSWESDLSRASEPSRERSPGDDAPKNDKE
jgi:hypothetical protein